jgi:putative endopeptidase
MNKLAIIALGMTLSPTISSLSQTTGGDANRVRSETGGRSWGFDMSAIDKSIRPGDNFFLYANGNYIRNLTIPADKTSTGLLGIMDDQSEAKLHQLMEAELLHPSGTPDEDKVLNFYKAFMDQERIEAQGTGPLKSDFDRVRAIRSKAEMSQFMGTTTKTFGASIIRTEVIPDSRDTTHEVLELSQSGLGLPGREFYLKPELAAKKDKYQDYIASILRLANWPEAERQAVSIVEFETRLAEASWGDEQERDLVKTYNPMSLEEVTKAVPGFDIRGFLKAADYGSERRFTIREKSALPVLASVFSATSLDTLKAWEAFHIADQASGFLPQRFVDAAFEFRNHSLYGQPQIAPRWQRAISQENYRIGDALGRLYVAHYFTPKAKDQMEQLVANLKAAFHDRLERAAWMSEATRAEAIKKLDTMSVGIGYPTKWKRYDFDVSPTDLYGDAERSIAWKHREAIERLHHPVDREAWNDLVPQSSASEYESSINRITFPAANFQFPFFDPNADPAVNYGAIGVVIGHEITHGFDDEGRHTDSAGLLRDWWTAEDAQKFKVQAERLSQQYSAFEPLPGVHVNGALTLGEDLADTGGMALSLDAYNRSLGGAAAPVLDGTTGDQRFFLSCAQIWAGKTREESIRLQLTNNPHPPGEQRVNGEVRNLDEWYAAFDVKPGDKLYIAPEDRVRIW